MTNMTQKMVGLLLVFCAGWSFAAQYPPPFSGSIENEVVNFDIYVFFLLVGLLLSWAGER